MKYILASTLVLCLLGMAKTALWAIAQAAPTAAPVAHPLVILVLSFTALSAIGFMAASRLTDIEEGV